MNTLKTIFKKTFLLLLSLCISCGLHGMKDDENKKRKREENEHEINQREKKTINLTELELKEKLDKVTLVAANGTEYKILKKDLKHAQTILNLIEDTGIEQPIPLPEISETILKIVIEAEQLLVNPLADLETNISLLITYLKNKKFDWNTLQELLIKSFYLDFEPLIKSCETLLGYNLVIHNHELNPTLQKDNFINTIFASLLEYNHLIFSEDEQQDKPAQQFSELCKKFGFVLFKILGHKNSRIALTSNTGKVFCKFYSLLFKIIKNMEENPLNQTDISLHLDPKIILQILQKTDLSITTENKDDFFKIIKEISIKYMIEFSIINKELYKKQQEIMTNMRKRLPTINDENNKEIYCLNALQYFQTTYEKNINKWKFLNNFFKTCIELEEMIAQMSDNSWIEEKNKFFYPFIAHIVHSYLKKYDAIKNGTSKKIKHYSSGKYDSSLLGVFLQDICSIFDKESGKALCSNSLFLPIFRLFLHDNFSEDQGGGILLTAIKLCVCCKNKDTALIINNKTTNLLLESITKKLEQEGLLKQILESKGKKFLYEALKDNKHNFDVVNHIVQQLEKYETLNKLLTKGYDYKKYMNILQLALNTRNLEIVMLIFGKISQLPTSTFHEILNFTSDKEKRRTPLWYALVISRNPLIAEYIITKFQTMNILEEHIKYLLSQNRNIAFNVLTMALEANNFKVLTIITDIICTVLNKPALELFCEKNEEGSTLFQKVFENAYDSRNIEMLTYIIDMFTNAHKLEELLEADETFEVRAPQVLRCPLITLTAKNKEALLLLSIKQQDMNLAQYVINLFLTHKINLWESEVNHKELCEKLLKITKENICPQTIFFDEFSNKYSKKKDISYLTSFWKVMLFLATAFQNVDFVEYVISAICNDNDLKQNIFIKNSEYHNLLLNNIKNNQALKNIINSNFVE